eukprot:996902-Pelagomonas_calceolata.AAC.3
MMDCASGSVSSMLGESCRDAGECYSRPPESNCSFKSSHRTKSVGFRPFTLQRHVFLKGHSRLQHIPLEAHTFAAAAGLRPFTSLTMF